MKKILSLLTVTSLIISDSALASCVVTDAHIEQIRATVQCPAGSQNCLSAYAAGGTALAGGVSAAAGARASLAQLERLKDAASRRAYLQWLTPVRNDRGVVVSDPFGDLARREYLDTHPQWLNSYGARNSITLAQRDEALRPLSRELSSALDGIPATRRGNTVELRRLLVQRLTGANSEVLRAIANSAPEAQLRGLISAVEGGDVRAIENAYRAIATEAAQGRIPNFNGFRSSVSGWSFADIMGSQGYSHPGLRGGEQVALKPRWRTRDGVLNSNGTTAKWNIATMSPDPREVRYQVELGRQVRRRMVDAVTRPFAFDPRYPNRTRLPNVNSVDDMEKVLASAVHDINIERRIAGLQAADAHRAAIRANAALPDYQQRDPGQLERAHSIDNYADQARASYLSMQADIRQPLLIENMNGPIRAQAGFENQRWVEMDSSRGTVRTSRQLYGRLIMEDGMNAADIVRYDQLGQSWTAIGDAAGNTARYDLDKVNEILPEFHARGALPSPEARNLRRVRLRGRAALVGAIGAALAGGAAYYMMNREQVECLSGPADSREISGACLSLLYQEPAALRNILNGQGVPENARCALIANLRSSGSGSGQQPGASGQ